MAIKNITVTGLRKKYLRAKDVFGVLKTTPEEAAAFSKRVKKIREELGKGMEKRIEEVRARLKRGN